MLRVWNKRIKSLRLFLVKVLETYKGFRNKNLINKIKI